MKIKFIIFVVITAAVVAFFTSSQFRKKAQKHLEPHINKHVKPVAGKYIGTPEEKCVARINYFYKLMQEEKLEKILEMTAESSKERIKKELTRRFTEFDFTYKVANAKPIPGHHGENIVKVKMTLEVRCTSDRRVKPQSEWGELTLEGSPENWKFISFEPATITYLSE